MRFKRPSGTKTVKTTYFYSISIGFLLFKVTKTQKVVLLTAVLGSRFWNLSWIISILSRIIPEKNRKTVFFVQISDTLQGSHASGKFPDFPICLEMSGNTIAIRRYCLMGSLEIRMESYGILQSSKGSPRLPLQFRRLRWPEEPSKAKGRVWEGQGSTRSYGLHGSP